MSLAVDEPILNNPFVSSGRMPDSIFEVNLIKCLVVTVIDVVSVFPYLSIGKRLCL